MRCPFLKEAEVRFCGVSPFRKMLLNTSRRSEEEKCTSAQFTSCPLVAGRREVHPGSESCPFLRRSLVQFCAAAPTTHYVPHSETLLSCCQNDGHRYCDLFLARAEPERAGQDRGAPRDGGKRRYDAIEMPAELAFSPNHMWLDTEEDGSCHLGVDAFLAAVIGPIERVSFVAPRNLCRPVAVLRVSGVDLTLVFPEPVDLNRSNVHLRSDPSRMTSDPYGRGWLFEGRVPSPSSREPRPHLLRGEEALAWMAREMDRMSAFVHEVHAKPGLAGPPLRNDGGAFRPPIVPHLGREDRMLLFYTFFSADRLWRSP